MSPHARRIQASFLLAIGALLAPVAAVEATRSCNSSLSATPPEGGGPLGSIVILDTGRSEEAESAPSPNSDHDVRHLRSCAFGRDLVNIGDSAKTCPPGMNCGDPGPITGQCKEGSGDAGLFLSSCGKHPIEDKIQVTLSLFYENYRPAPAYVRLSVLDGTTPVIPTQWVQAPQTQMYVLGCLDSTTLGGLLLSFSEKEYFIQVTIAPNVVAPFPPEPPNDYILDGETENYRLQVKSNATQTQPPTEWSLDLKVWDTPYDSRDSCSFVVP